MAQEAMPEEDEQAQEAYERAALLKEQGYLKVQRGKLDEGLVLLEQALALEERPDEELLFNLVTIAQQLGDCRRTVLFVTGYLALMTGDESEERLRQRRERCLARVNGGQTLQIQSTPTGAKVRLNNVLIGRTPLRSVKLIPGSYQLTASETDYEVYRSNVAIETSVSASLSFRMARMIFHGNLTVTTDPPGATVYLNHDNIGVSPVTRENLETRRYLVRIEHENWDRWIRYVRVERDRTVEVDATLERTDMVVPIPPLPTDD
jgi:hypothetical protein